MIYVLKAVRSRQAVPIQHVRRSFPACVLRVLPISTSSFNDPNNNRWRNYNTLRYVFFCRPLTSSSWGPNILLSILFSCTLNAYECSCDVSESWVSRRC